MRISQTKKIVVEDFDAKDRPFVQKLAGILNPLIEQLVTALTSNLTATDNLKSKTWSVALPAGTAVKTLSWDVNEKPTNIQLMSLSKSDGSAPSAAFSLAWSYGNGTVTATFLGLDSLTDYKATLIGLV